MTHTQSDSLTEILVRFGQECIQKAYVTTSPQLANTTKSLQAHIDKLLVEAEKRGFYWGQANAKVELYDCHENWKKFNAPELKGKK